MKRMRRCWWQVVFALALLGLPGLNRAQEPDSAEWSTLPSLDAQVRARFISLDGRLNPVHSPQLAASVVGHLCGSPFASCSAVLADARNNEVWRQLPEEYYRMAQESGDALVALPRMAAPGDGALSSAQVQRLCHQRLTMLPRSALRWYRQRVDAEAKALYEQGRQTRTPGPLRRLVDELFCSSVGDQALDLLGDLAFERGEFQEACHWWSRLAPLEAPWPEQLTFPDPQVDLARVRAKQILARIFQGRFDDAQSALARLQRQHPGAQGDLAAEHGPYAAILAKTLAAYRQQPAGTRDGPWTTFAGDGTRGGQPAADLSWRLWEDGPAWRVALPSLSSATPRDPVRTHPQRRVAFHPVIVNHQVLLADHRSVVSYKLTTGRELFRFDLKSAALADPGPGVDPRVRRPRFTLSGDRERAYARLGAAVPLTFGRGGAVRVNGPSFLICLDLTEPDVKKPRLLWHVPAPADEKAPAYFEGAPLVQNGRVFATLSKLVGERVITSIVCYDTRGRQRWAREVCDCPEVADSANGQRDRQHLLASTGGQIVYCSHAGAIVAVDLWTGQPTWGVRYRSRGPRARDLALSPRDLAPCVCVDGLVYAAPLDSERVFCIDASTGHVRWTLEDTEVTHLLGVARGRLIFGTRDGVRAVDATTGQFGWMQPSAGRLPGLGRGMIAGSWVLWPTQDTDLPYRALSVDAGAPTVDPTRLHTLPVGNAAFGHGCLAIAGVAALSVYVPPGLSPLSGPRPQAWIDAPNRKTPTHATGMMHGFRTLAAE